MKLSKRIASIAMAGAMAVGSVGIMAGCELPQGLEDILPGFDSVQVTGPNGEVVKTNATEVKRIIQDLPEMLKMASDPTYVNEAVEEIDSDTLIKLSTIYSLKYMIKELGVFNEENLNLLQQALPEKEDSIDVRLPIPRGLVGYNDMLYSILVEKVSKRVVQEDYSMSDEVIAYNVKFLVPKSIETKIIGGKDLEYVTYYSCCGSDHDNETHYNEDGSYYRYTYPRRTFYDLQKLTTYITEGAKEGIAINYCEHTKPLFDAYFASLQGE